MNFQRNRPSVETPSASPHVRPSIAAIVNKIAIGSFAALSISNVVDRRGGEDCRRKIEKIAAASVEEMITDNNTAFSNDHPKTPHKTKKGSCSGQNYAPRANPPAGKATARKSPCLVAKPPCDKMKTKAKLATWFVKATSSKYQTFSTSLPNTMPAPSATRITGTLNRSSHTAARTTKSAAKGE